MSPTASRYDLLAKLASGGMGTVFVGRVRGAHGFTRLVAIKRAHPHLADDPTFSKMLVDEAKLASKISHPHVVAVLDVERVRLGDAVEKRREIRLVMDYVEGATLIELMNVAERSSSAIPPGVAVRIILDAAAGLQAAHELVDENGDSLGIVHRDISPHNVLVGIDGMARLTDFGIAKATMKPGATTSGDLKGKLAYMAPEYVEKNALDARSDVFALGVVAWEALAGRRLFKGATELETLQLVADAKAPALSSVRPEVGSQLDDVLGAVLARDPDQRFASARAFATALESQARQLGLVATHADVSAYVREATKDTLGPRRDLIRARARELDAQLPSSTTTQEDELRAAVEAAERFMRSGSKPDSVQNVPDAPGLTPQGAGGTLDGSTDKTHRRPKAARAERGRWWLYGLAGGVAAAAIAFAVVRFIPSGGGGHSGVSASAETPLAGSNPPVAASTVAVGAISIASSAESSVTPTPSSAISMHVPSSVARPKSSRPIVRTQPPPPDGVPPNPYAPRQ